MYPFPEINPKTIIRICCPNSGKLPEENLHKMYAISEVNMENNFLTIVSFVAEMSETIIHYSHSQVDKIVDYNRHCCNTSVKDML